MKLEPFELEFNDVSDYIYKPIQSILTMYQMQKRYERMSEALQVWRVLRPLSHVFIDNAENMYTLKKINAPLLNFFRQAGWPLKNQSMDSVNPRVVELFDQALPTFNKHDFTQVGSILAQIAYLLAQPNV